MKKVNQKVNLGRCLMPDARRPPAHHYFKGQIFLKTHPKGTKATEKLVLTLVLLNLDMPCLCKQCRSEANWSGSILFINNLDQVIWLAENYKWAWHLNLFSMTRVKAAKLNNTSVFTIYHGGTWGYTDLLKYWVWLVRWYNIYPFLSLLATASRLFAIAWGFTSRFSSQLFMRIFIRALVLNQTQCGIITVNWMWSCGIL